MAEEVIPPAYPAPSPVGYIPPIFDSKFSFLRMRTTEEVLASIPIRSACGFAKPFIFLSSSGSDALIALITKSGRQQSREVRVIFGL